MPGKDKGLKIGRKYFITPSGMAEIVIAIGILVRTFYRSDDGESLIELSISLVWVLPRGLVKHTVEYVWVDHEF